MFIYLFIDLFIYLFILISFIAGSKRTWRFFWIYDEFISILFSSDEIMSCGRSDDKDDVDDVDESWLIRLAPPSKTKKYMIDILTLIHDVLR